MENITENNKSIGEFINLEEYNSSEFLIGDYSIRRKDDLDYHISFDWLMPVVEKIGDLILVGNDGEPISYRVTMYDRICKIEYSSITHGWTLLFERDGNTLLESTYNVVVKFIKWYNENEMKVYQFKK